MRDLRAGATSAAAVAAAALSSCAPVLHDANLVRVTPVRSAEAGVTRTDSTYANAIVAIDRRDYARALELLQMARQHNAGDVRVLNAMGVVYDKLGRFDLSRRYYAEAAKADPSSPIVQANIAYSQRLQDGSSGVQFAEAPILKVSPPATAATVVELQTPQKALPQRVTPASPPGVIIEKAAAPSAAAAVPALVPAAPLRQLQAEATVKAQKVSGLSPLHAPRIELTVPPPSRLDASSTAARASAPQASPRFVTAVQPAGPLQQIEAVSALKVRSAVGLSKSAPPQTAALATAPTGAQPAPVARPTIHSAVSAAGAAHVRPEQVPARTLGAVTGPSGPLSQIQFVGLIKAQAAAGLTRLAALRIDVAEMNAPPLAAPAEPQASRATRAGAGPMAPSSTQPITLARVAAPKPAALRLATPRLQPTSAGPRLVVAGRQPLRVVNATGRLYRAEPVRASLAGLGWSAPRWAMAEARPQKRTVIIYPANRVAIAKALARTLPGSARLAVCTNGCTGLQLVLGADARSWKPMPQPVVRTSARSRKA